MLIAIYLFLTGGGSSFVTLDFIEEKEDLVAVVVVDEARKKNSLGILKQMTSRAEVFKKQRGALMKRTKKLINENADVHAIDNVISTHFKNHKQYNAEMVDLRFELKDQLTEKEWKAIFVVSK